MSFKLYRPKETVQAQVVEQDMKMGDVVTKKGDYLVLKDGVATVHEKGDFESKYELVRQKKNKALEGSTSKAKDKKKTQVVGEVK